MAKDKEQLSKVSEGEFLRDAPSKIRAILAWFHDGAKHERVSKEVEDYARGFLAGIHEDGALFPVSKKPAWLLAMVLTQHRRNPSQPIGWLNLGLALRRMALYETSAPESLRNKWLDLALQSPDESLRLEPDNVRAWTGRGFVFHQLGRYEEEIRCYRRALDIDSSNVELWLVYVNALRVAGREDEAAAHLEEAYHGYLPAGQPQELREIFEKFGPAVSADLTKIQ
jgi:tetratricopeptide (TPR) repeat protein